MTIAAVLFDIGGTLWHGGGAPPPETFRRLAAARAAEELARQEVASVDPAVAARTAWDALEAAMRQARATDLVEPDYGAVSQEALATLGLELPRERAAAFLDAIYISGVEGGKA